MRYDRNMVLAAYRAAHPDNREPKPKTITDFDENLFKTYDAEMRKQAEKKQIPATKFNLSMLVFFANQSLAEGVDTRVGHAFKYFKAVQPQP